MTTILKAVASFAWLGGLLYGCASSHEVTKAQPSAQVTAFYQLQQEDQARQQVTGGHNQAQSTKVGDHHRDDFLIATGYGDLTKGHLICQRVADMAARAELAKLIRVYIEEHATDRVRETNGTPVEQDIEVVREEVAKEMLHDAKIVRRSADQGAGTCYSTAVMPRSYSAPKLIERPNTIPTAGEN